jgi:hypothetical protein
MVSVSAQLCPTHTEWWRWSSPNTAHQIGLYINTSVTGERNTSMKASNDNEKQIEQDRQNISSYFQEVVGDGWEDKSGRDIASAMAIVKAKLANFGGAK